MTQHKRSPHQRQQPRPRHTATHIPRTHTLYSSQFLAKKEELRKTTDNLHKKLRRIRCPIRAAQVEKELTETIRSWNVNVLGLKTSCDLHWATPNGALEIVWEMVEKSQRQGVFEIITGKGLHSKGGIPRIRQRILEEFGGEARCHIEEKMGNSGVLVFHFY